MKKMKLALLAAGAAMSLAIGGGIAPASATECANKETPFYMCTLESAVGAIGGGGGLHLQPIIQMVRI